MTSKLIVNSLAADTGVSTITFADQAKMGNSLFHSTGFTIGDSFLHSTGVNLTNVNATGVITATKFVGEVSVGSSITFEDNEKAYFGTSTDFSIYHNGSASYLDETGTGGLIVKTDTAFQVFNSAGSQAALTVTPGGSVELYHGSTKRIETDSLGINVLGRLDVSGTGANDHLNVDSNTTRLRIGGYADLQLFHDTSNVNYIQSHNDIDLHIRSTYDDSSQKVQAKFIHDGAVELYHNGSLKLTTGNNGINVSGSIALADSGRLYLGSSNDAYLYHDGSNTHFYNQTGHLQIRQAANSDIEIQTNATQRLRIYNDGIVAIGQSAKSTTVGAGGLDIQGNATSCIIEMGNPFPNYGGGVVPEFRITATNSGHKVDFESVWGGDNLLHKHLSFSGGSTTFHKGINDDEVARFTSSGQLILNSTSVTNSNDYFTVTRPATGFGEMSMTVDANTSTSSAANAFIFTKSKHTYWNGYGFQSSHGHIGAIVGKRDSTGGDSDQEIRIEIGGTHINQSEEKTWNFKNNGDLSISDGNLVVASGHGIDFSATGNSSGTMSNELFDDYEEGTWTPTAHGYTGSNTSNNCHYTKIGRLVTASFRITWPSLTSTTNAEIRGLPFSSITTGEYVFGGAFSETNDNDSLSFIVVSNSSKMLILRCTSSGVDTQNISEVSGKDFRGTVSYFTNS